MELARYLTLFRGLDEDFQRIALELERMFASAGQAVGGRGTHTDGVSARGTLTVLRDRDLPTHDLFAMGSTYDVVFRHANVVGGSADDAAPNGRGAAIRIGNTGQDLTRPALHDMVLNTGRTFGLPTARLYREFFRSTFHEKSDLLVSGKLRRNGVVEALRDPLSYTEVRYHSQLCFEWIDRNRLVRYARFRLLDPKRKEEGGLLDSKEEIGPRLVLPRRPGDSRDKEHLRKEFRQRLTRGPVEYLIQVQLRSFVPEALDCTVLWDADIYPWLNLATIRLIEDVSEQPQYRDLAYNPGNTHATLQFPASRNADDLASLGMSGALVHYYGARVRREGTQYLYGEPDALPTLPDYLPLPMAELPSARYLFLREMYPEVKLKPGEGRDRAEQILTSMPICAMEIAVGRASGSAPIEVPDKYFLERRINGYNPGAIRDAGLNCDWSHDISFDLTPYALKPGLSFPGKVQCRIQSKANATTLHSIQIDGTTYKPGDANWPSAKSQYLQAEFVLQELRLHLGRCHINMEQYALAGKRRLSVGHPVRRFLDPHIEGLMFINKVGVPLIVGTKGFITAASALTTGSITEIMRQELRKLSHLWDPVMALPQHAVWGDRFSPVVRVFWELLDEYVTQGLLTPFAAELEAAPYKQETAAFFAELQERSLYNQGTINFDPSELKSLLKYIVYHSTFLHSWVNFKQYDDAGSPAYVTMGEYDQFGPATADFLRVMQKSLTWVLSLVRYNPAMVYGSELLKRLIRDRESLIKPGVPLEDLMLSINI